MDYLNGAQRGRQLCPKTAVCVLIFVKKLRQLAAWVSQEPPTRLEPDQEAW